MLKPTAFANAVTVVWAAAYLICFILTLVAPELVFGVVRSWAHSINIDAVKSTEPINIGSSLFGAVTFGAYVWVVTYAAATLYNRFAKNGR